MLTEIEQLIYQEAALIDQRRFDEWLDLFTEDALYWLPTDEEHLDKQGQVSIIREDLEGIRKRIKRIEHPNTPTELPPRRTRHFISNLLVSDTAADELRVTSNQL